MISVKPKGTCRPIALGPLAALLFLSACVQHRTIGEVSSKELGGTATVLTQHNDNARTGAQLSETVLAPAVLSGGAFGKLGAFVLQSPAQIYAQPLVARVGSRNLLIVATMDNFVYAFDADASNPSQSNSSFIWRSYVGDLPDTSHGDGNVAQTKFATPGSPQVVYGPGHPSIKIPSNSSIGIMSTPVIDPARGVVFLVARTTTSNSRPAFRIYALSLLDGTLKASSDIGCPANGCLGSTSTTQGRDGIFYADHQLNRPALLLSGGHIYISFGGASDTFTDLGYHGWIMEYQYNDTASPPNFSQSAVYSSTIPERLGGGIWQAGNGLAADASGNIYFLTGNGEKGGTVDTQGNAIPPVKGSPYGDEDSIVGLTPGLGPIGKWYPGLAPLDPAYFNQHENGDADMSSAGALLVPPHHLIGGGKDGILHVIDRNTMQQVYQLQAFHDLVRSDQSQPTLSTNFNVCIPVDQKPTNCSLPGLNLSWDPERFLCAAPDSTFEEETDFLDPSNYASDAVGPHIHGSPIMWQVDGQSTINIYGWSEKDRLRQFKYDPTAGTLTPAAASFTRAADGSMQVIAAPPSSMPGGVLSVSANAGTPGTGIVWGVVQDPNTSCADPTDQGVVPNVHCNTLGKTVNGRLFAFDADSLERLWDSSITNFSKFSAPTIANGRVYVATMNGEVLVFGVQPPAQDIAPRGSVDHADCYTISGWAQDLDDAVQPIAVHVYFDAPYGQPGANGPYKTVAALPRGDLCQVIGSCNHAFSFPTPSSLMDGASHSVYAYAINIGAPSNPLLQPVATVTCPTAPVRGSLDRATCTIVEGWAQNPAPTQKDNPQNVDISIDDIWWQSVPANISRPDLCSGIGSCAHAFSVPLPSALADGNSHQIAIYSGGTALGSKNVYCGGDLGVLPCPISFSYTVGAETGAQVLAGYVNEDHYADVVSVGGVVGTTPVSTISIAISRGNGAFDVENRSSDQPGMPFSSQWASQSHATAVAGDFDGDGKMDIALVGGGGWYTIPVAFSNGDGTFRITNQTPTGGTPNGPEFASAWPQTKGAKAVAGDFNGDGYADIALVGGAGWYTIPIALSKGDGNFQTVNLTPGQAVFATTWAQTAGAKPVVGDFNQDGKADIALVGGQGWHSIPVAFSAGNGNFTVTNGVPSLLDFATGWAQTTGVQVVTGDFNHDHRSDIALVGGAQWHTIPIAFSNGDGSFTVTNQTPSDPTFATNWAQVPGAKAVSGDFDNDGFADIALVGGAGWHTLPVAFSVGDGNFRVASGDDS